MKTQNVNNRQRNFKSRARLAVVVASSGALAASALAMTGPVAHADPLGSTAAKPLIGVGSNAFEDLLDAYGGSAPTPNNVLGQAVKYYIPIGDIPADSADTDNTGTTLEYFDALDPTLSPSDQGGEAITTKPGGDSFARPDGATDGVLALSDAQLGDSWQKKTGGTPAAPVNGEINFAASSSNPPSSGSTAVTAATGDLTWVDFAHDAVSYMYYSPDWSSLTTAQQTDIENLPVSVLLGAYQFKEGTEAPEFDSTGVAVIGADDQYSAGTAKSFEQDLGIPSASLPVETSAPAALNGVLNQDDGNDLVTQSAVGIPQFVTDESSHGVTSSTPVVVVAPMSVGNWIAQQNGTGYNISSSLLANNGGIGNPLGSGTPTVSGTAPSLTTNLTYEDSQFGRELYIVVPYNDINVSRGYSATYRAFFGYDTGAASTGITAASEAVAGTETGALEGSVAQNELAAFGLVPPQSSDGGTLGGEIDTTYEQNSSGTNEGS